ncbi:MAG: phage tail tape measure protein [Ignavibacteria bacterium]|nr:phage tail tape measure protein [Ignavibacteria bacterium]
MASYAEVNIPLRLDPVLDVAKINVFVKALKASLGQYGKDIKLLDGAAIQKELDKLAKETDKAAKIIKPAMDNIHNSMNQPLGTRMFNAANFTTVLHGISESLGEVSKAYADYEKELAAVGAITGLRGNDLQKLGKDARHLADEFGQGVNTELKTYQFLLSKIGPQLAQNQEGLTKMVKTINLFAAAGGVEAQEGALALSDAMLQMGLATRDADKDAETMMNMANAIAAGVKVGAAEIPQMSEAILQVGAVSKEAGLNINELNATLQAMAVGGKYGAEAGTVLRNILTKMQGMAGEEAEELSKYGLTVKQLSSTLQGQGIGAALTLLKKSFDSNSNAAERNASIMKIFDKYNGAALMGLLRNVDTLKMYQTEIDRVVAQGDAATDGVIAQAAIRMDTADTKLKKFASVIEEQYIKLGEAAGQGFSVAVGGATKIMPIVSSLNAMKHLIPQEMIGNVAGFSKSILGTMIPSLRALDGATGKTVTGLGSLKNGLGSLLSSGGFQAIIAVGAVVAVVAAVKALTDAWHTTAEEKLAGAKADGEMIASAQKAVNAQITLIGVNNEAINQYAELGAKANRTAEEQDAFEKATMSVARSFPHAWQATATFAENVDALKKKSAEAAGQLDNLMKKSEQLAAKAAENDKYQIKLGVDVAKEDIEDAFADAGSILHKGADWLFGTSTSRQIGEGFTEAYSKGIYQAKSAPEVEQATALFQEEVGKQLADAGGLSNEEKKAIMDKIRSFGDARLSQLEADGKRESAQVEARTTRAVGYYEGLTRAGLSSDEAVSKVATRIGITTDEARKLLATDAMKKVSTDGRATENQVAQIAKQFGFSADQAQRLADQIARANEEAGKMPVPRDVGEIYDQRAKSVADAIAKQETELRGLEYQRVIRSKKDKKNMEDAVIGETNASLAQKLDTGNRTLKNSVSRKRSWTRSTRNSRSRRHRQRRRRTRTRNSEALKVAKAKAETADDMLTSKTRSRPCVRGVN